MLVVRLEGRRLCVWLLSNEGRLAFFVGARGTLDKVRMQQRQETNEVAV